MSKQTDRNFEAESEAGPKQRLPSWIRKNRHGLRIKLVFSGSEIDKDGFISEHDLRTAFADLLLAEDQVYGKGVRPWRKWEGCTTFGDILVCSVAKVAEGGVLHVEEEMKNGRSREVARAPAACCIAKGCGYHTKSLSGEDAVNALWGHLSTSSANEAEASRKSQDRSKLLHPTQPMIEQLNHHCQIDEHRSAAWRHKASQSMEIDSRNLARLWDYREHQTSACIRPYERGREPEPLRRISAVQRGQQLLRQ